MGIMLSVLISYVGIHEAIECLKHIISGLIPDTEPNFNDLVEYYTHLLRKTANSPKTRDWTTECGQGYLYLNEDKDGRIKSASIKFYNTPSNSTALLFSTKISSFGQDSVEENSQANGDYRTEKYPATKTKTIISNTSESFSVGNKTRPAAESISDPTSSPMSPNSFDNSARSMSNDAQLKLTWEYTPKTPPSTPVPEIHFQPYGGDNNGDIGYSEEFLRSLDGIKFRPLQRNDPSGRRRSFRRRTSSSSNSSRESRASREEELRIFTSLEEDEFKNLNKDANNGKFGSAPNLAARSYSRSRSREKSKERRTESPIPEVTDGNTPGETKPPHSLKDVPKLSTFEEKDETNDTELIFSGEYTKAMNKDWHSGHFCCWKCDESLTGQRYVLRDEQPYCIKCYEGVFANGCEECNKIIGIDSKDLSYKDKHWHEACFLCAKCRVSLVDKQFGSKLDKIYCGNCYDAQFASRCDGCGEVFRAGTKKMEYKTRQWHEKCFCCVVCKKAIGTKSFIPREQEIYCTGCYENKFSTRCVKCNKIITQDGVTYKHEPWHRECFTCTHCNNSLAGERFTSRDEKPYCSECFGELFAKRCTACSKPITGIGGTRFISFEDRHWHNNCFQCAYCKVSLVGKGFITVEQDVICPECAKQKIV
ncbi:transforming growth factor beta-1-induced transcript 1 protein isoform X7 [Danaus plexippus]|uniref:transforming growth factor beta-1-induced transcript 1 protein isoform X7 n=1 Tax=Danaus plexippus TaxID=13037 RepID=UPI002AB0A5A2|nr:transforming growth factor beta-1-induced transcript 1 protein isoform X7 [Danaus plexippus]